MFQYRYDLTSTKDEEKLIHLRVHVSSKIRECFSHCKLCAGEVTEITNDGDNGSFSDLLESRNDYKIFVIDLLSNISFFAGSGCSVITSIWDFQWFSNLQQLDDDYYYYYYDCEKNNSAYCDGIVSFTLDSYTILSILGSCLMIANATLDLYQCKLLSMHNELHSIWHSAIRSDFLAASSFGVAAIIELTALFLTGDVVHLVYVASIASSHLYLLSAILSLMNTQLCHCHVHLSRGTKLRHFGDWLFLIGSLIDTIISIASDPDVIKVNGWVLCGLNVLSSILWLCDAGKTYSLFSSIVHNT